MQKLIFIPSPTPIGSKKFNAPHPMTHRSLSESDALSYACACTT